MSSTVDEKPSEAPSDKPKKASFAHRLYTGQLSFNFVDRWKTWFTISGVLLSIAIIALATVHLNLSIEFRGGSQYRVPTTVTSSSVDTFRRAAQSSGVPSLGDVEVQAVGSNQVLVEVRALNGAEIGQMRTALAGAAQVDPTKVTDNLIGPSWGQQITQSGLIALAVFLVLVSLLIWAYFRDWKMAVAAITGVLHDLLLTLGVFAVTRAVFSPASLIGMLTILGYSLYDNVVVFDKVRENVKDITKQNRTYGQAANTSVNQTLVRSINTTIIGVLPVAALLFAGIFILGTGPLKDLGIALFVGMIAGAYSSIFIATPLLVLMRESEPAMKEHKERLARREARRAKAAEAVVTQPLAVDGEAVDPVALAAVPASEVPDGTRYQPKRSSRSERKKP